MLIIAGDKGGCGYYRCMLPAKHLGYEIAYGIPVIETETEFLITDKRVDDNEWVMIQRADHPFYIDWIHHAHTRGQKIIYDIDDNVWNIPQDNPVSPKYTKDILVTISEIVRVSDVVSVSTPELAKFISNNFNRNVIIVPNMVDSIRPVREFDKPTIGWWGSNTHIHDFTWDLKEKFSILAKKYDFTCVGYDAVPGAKHIDFVPPAELMDLLYDSGISILLAPLRDNLFNRCKSNVKYLEASACGMCTISSNVAAYSNHIRHRENGCIVRSAKDWETEILFTLDNFGEIQSKSHKYVLENYCWETCSDKILELHKSKGIY